jgi:hypothetical protein
MTIALELEAQILRYYTPRAQIFGFTPGGSSVKKRL